MGDFKRVLYVARGVLPVIPPGGGETRYLLGQRNFTGKHDLRGYWECFGGSASDGQPIADVQDEGRALDLLKKTVTRELRRELGGITIVSVDEVLHQYRRPSMPLPEETRAGSHAFDIYTSVHFLVQAKLPDSVIIDEAEHCGFGLFTAKQVLSLMPDVRSCSLRAVQNANLLSYGHRFNIES
jgi:hypothetical protein